MDLTPLSFSSPSSQICSTSDGETTWTAVPKYQSLMPPASYQFDDSQAIHGLGISLHGTEISLTHHTFDPRLERPPPPVPRWPEQMELPQHVGSMPAERFAFGMDYVLFSNSRTGSYGSQEMCASSSYGGSQDSISDQPHGLTPSPCPGNFSPFSRHEADKLHEDTSWLEGQEMSYLPQMPQAPTTSAFPTPPLEPDTLLGLYRSAEQEQHAYNRFTVKSTPIEAGSGTESRRRKRSLRNSHDCPICGMQFTRSGNCSDHIKKAHDPNFKRSPCPLCGRDFQRPHDVRRHIDSV